MRAVVRSLRTAWNALSDRGRYWVILASAVAFFSIALIWRSSSSGRPYIVQAIVDELGMRQVEGFAGEIRFAAAESSIDPLLIAAICFHESRGRSGQVSSAGALGLMQLVPAAAGDAARRLAIDPPTDDQVLGDPALSLRLGAAHLAWLLDHSADWPLEKVLVSYNAGRARLFQWMEAAGGYPSWVRAQESKMADGERTNGALIYARGVLLTMSGFQERGRIVADS
ncbi:MAG: soluble lytic murein transglycosylase-like protein [Planctomycetota bacterium]|jgi:soluble lytic murein transglycosylase-like protein